MKTQFILTILLMAAVVVVTGCGFFAQPGMTAQEAHREHLRILRVNNQQMMRDVDRVLGFDQPSMLTDKKLP
jgi:outer membrane lipopolysaccharide assembly protein LptE/RlpB